MGGRLLRPRLLGTKKRVAPLMEPGLFNQLSSALITLKKRAGGMPPEPLR
jgi:hypothetical protein